MKRLEMKRLKELIENRYIMFEKIADFEGTITITLFVENLYFEDGHDEDDYKYLFKETYNFSM